MSDIDVLTDEQKEAIEAMQEAIKKCKKADLITKAPGNFSRTYAISRTIGDVGVILAQAKDEAVSVFPVKKPGSKAKFVKIGAWASVRAQKAADGTMARWTPFEDMPACGVELSLSRFHYVCDEDGNEVNLSGGSPNWESELFS